MGCNPNLKTNTINSKYGYDYNTDNYTMPNDLKKMKTDKCITHMNDIKNYVLSNPILFKYYDLGRVQYLNTLWRILRVETLQIIKAVNKSLGINIKNVIVNKQFLDDIIKNKWYEIPFHSLYNIDYC